MQMNHGRSPVGVVAAGNVEGTHSGNRCQHVVNHRTPPTAQRASHKRHAIDLILIIPCMYGLHVVVMCLEQADPMTGRDQIPSSATSLGPGWVRPGLLAKQVSGSPGLWP